MLANIKDMCKEAASSNRIVPGFNVFGYEDAQIIIEVAKELKAPAIFMSNTDAVTHMPLEVAGAMYKAMAEATEVEVVLHLDHGKSFDLCKRAIDAGYTSVMFDGSQKPFEENVKRTKEIVDYAHKLGVSVEAEIGAVGYNDPSIAYKPVYTEPNEAKEFAKQTGVDALAVAVGTLHRMTSQDAVLQYELLKEIETVTDVPLVIHGSTGLSDEDLVKLKPYRIGKMNIGTAVRMAFGNGMRDFFNSNPEEFDRIKAFAPAMALSKEVVMKKYRLLGW